MNQSGQALLIILLATLVSLTIGLAITQRSLTDVATSTRIDQSTRAFSAAEAGIEKAIGTTTAFDSSAGSSPVPYITSAELGNQSSADVSASGFVQISAADNVGLEYPKIDKTSFAQFWLADPDTLTTVYNLSTFDLYFGNQTQVADTFPGVEVTTVTRTISTGAFQAYRAYYESLNTRVSSNNFIYGAPNGTCDGNQTISTYNLTSSSPTLSKFYCKYNVKIGPPNSAIINIANETPILVRIRLLYDIMNEPQKIGLAPTSGSSTVLPAQIVIYTSKGYSGQTQRKLHLFVQKNVTPFYFDFSIFSSGPICKNSNTPC